MGKTQDQESFHRHSQSTIWIDVNDFLRSLDWSVAPVGIQRVQMEVLPHLLEMYPDQVRLVSIGPGIDNVRHVSQKEFLKRLVAFRKRQLRGNYDLVRLRISQALNNGWRLLKQALSSSPKPRFRKRDIILNLGASWEHEAYAKAIAALIDQHQIRFALLVHDLLPLTHPQYVSPPHIPNFRNWFASVAPLLSVVLTPSKATADAVEAFLGQEGYKLPHISPVRFGTGYSAQETRRASRMDMLKPFVLFVSTIEVRKNHLLLVQVWERLITEMGASQVPDLLFVGKFGWEVDALRAKLAETGNLNGKVVVRQSLSDADLDSAYRQSMFTVFPSFCEGWGLPVSESLSHGKFCVASNATSIPEIGGDLLAYIDPGNVDEAYALVLRVLFEDGYLAEKEKRIASEFMPTMWESTAAEILATLHYDGSEDFLD